MKDAATLEIMHRIEIAREFRRHTCGGVPVTPALFGDRVDYASGNERFAAYAKQYRADESPEQKRQRAIKQFRAAKLKYGGCQGIIEHRLKGGKFRFEIRLVDHCERFDCAIEAAKRRNQVMSKYWPGVDEVLVDLDAVFRRWGCGCGKHGRGKR